LVTKKSAKKKAKKRRIKTLELKRDTIKDVSGREKKKVKGGGGLAGSVLMGARY
jgi:hypothetical protein